MSEAVIAIERDDLSKARTLLNALRNYIDTIARQNGWSFTPRTEHIACEGSLAEHNETSTGFRWGIQTSGGWMQVMELMQKRPDKSELILFFRRVGSLGFERIEFVQGMNGPQAYIQNMHGGVVWHGSSLAGSESLVKSVPSPLNWMRYLEVIIWRVLMYHEMARHKPSEDGDGPPTKLDA
ncbi:MAG: hypothetical protein O3B64_03630 [bacterium]|nr:hypothetical protein [bacterium]